MSANALEITDLRFRWPGDDRDLLRLDHLAVETGQHLFISGRSGSGKTSLLNLIGGVTLANSGSVCVLGQDYADLPAGARDSFRADHFGIIFQQFNLLPWASAIDNVLLALRFSTARRSRVEKTGSATTEAVRLMTALGLGHDIANRPANRLSIGQQQRVATARALIGQPDFIVADEPTSALDHDNGGRFLDLLFEQADASGATIMMVSHDDRLADRFKSIFHLAGGPEC